LWYWQDLVTNGNKYQFQHAAAKLTMANSQQLRSSTSRASKANPSNAGRQNQPGDRKEYFTKRIIREKICIEKICIENDAIGRWNDLKTEAGIKSDEEFTNTLLSLFKTSRRIQLR
jgi:hypothetical protein